MNKETLIMCAQLCKASYDDKDTRFTTIDELSFGVINIMGVTYLVFRGTYNIKGWLHDFTVVPSLTKGGYLAHTGFIFAMHELWNPICKSLDGLPRPWIITGHSLGGALAVLYGEQIKVPTITFGSPRVYSRMNGNIPKIDHYRIITDDDLVPHVPESLMWKHDCDPYLILKDNDKEYINVEDHDINVYISQLTK